MNNNSNPKPNTTSNNPKPYFNKYNNYNKNNNNNNNNNNRPTYYKKPYGVKQQISEMEIHPLQEKNPVWSVLKIPWKKNEELVADFMIPESFISIVFLSLQFHQNYPLYIEDKLEKFIKSEDVKRCPNKILLCLFDVEDTNNNLMDINLLCIEKNVKLLVGFSFSEIANYIASFKYIEKVKKSFKNNTN